MPEFVLRRLAYGCLASLLAFLLTVAPPRRVSAAEPTQRRHALVLANSSYSGAALSTAANDAGLIAAVLHGAGFEVTAARDLDLATERQSIREFLNKVAAAGPGGTAFVYVNGIGAQVLGENYLLAGNSPRPLPAELPGRGLMLAQLLQGLAAAPVRQRIVVIDIARPDPLAHKGMVAGLVLPDVPSGLLLAMNAAPGTLAAAEPGPYSTYVLALAEALREPGLPLDELFARTRLRTHILTGGAQTPWSSATLRDTAPLVALPAGQLLPPELALESVRARRVSDLPLDEAYYAALDRDTLKGYEEFVATWPEEPLARRIAALLAARREALAWRQTLRNERETAYANYLARYGEGAHAQEAREQLAAIATGNGAADQGASDDDGLAAPLAAERVYLARGAVIDPPDYFAPPPPPPVWSMMRPPWTPPRPPASAEPFALAVPDLPPLAGAAPAPAPNSLGIALPAAVTAALAAKQLAPPKADEAEASPSSKLHPTTSANEALEKDSAAAAVVTAPAPPAGPRDAGAAAPATIFALPQSMPAPAPSLAPAAVPAAPAVEQRPALVPILPLEAVPDSHEPPLPPNEPTRIVAPALALPKAPTTVPILPAEPPSEPSPAAVSLPAMEPRPAAQPATQVPILPIEPQGAVPETPPEAAQRPALVPILPGAPEPAATAPAPAAKPSAAAPAAVVDAPAAIAPVAPLIAARVKPRAAGKAGLARAAPGASPAKPKPQVEPARRAAKPPPVRQLDPSGEPLPLDLRPTLRPGSQGARPASCGGPGQGACQ